MSARVAVSVWSSESAVTSVSVSLILLTVTSASLSASVSPSAPAYTTRSVLPGVFASSLASV